MAQPLSWIYTVGSRKSDGSVNAGGTVEFVSNDDINTRVSVYKDADESETWAQPLTLDGAGKASAAVFLKDPCRIIVYDSSSAVVSDEKFEGGVDDDNVEVMSAAFNGTVSGSSTAGARIDLNTVLTRAQDSFGGTDWTYKDSAGGTERAVRVVITETGLSVKSRGAQGNGTTVDTAAFNSAIQLLKAAGGGMLLIPPGTYLIDAALLVDFSNLHIRGLGGNVAIVTSSSSANVLTVSLSGGVFAMDGVNIAPASTVSADSTGYAVSLTNVTQSLISNVRINPNGSGHRFDRGYHLVGCTYNTIVGGAVFADEHAIRLHDSGCQFNAIVGGTWDADSGTAASLYVDGATYTTVLGAHLQGTGGNAITTANAVNGLVVSGVVRGGVTLSSGTVGFVDAGIYTNSGSLTNNSTTGPNYFGALAGMRPFGNGKGNSTGAVQTISGVGTFTPDLTKGTHQIVTLDNAASALTVAIPATSPPDGFEFTLSIVNTAAPTSAAFAGGYKNLAAVAVSLVNGNISTYTIKRINGNWYITDGVVGTA